MIPEKHCARASCVPRGDAAVSVASKGGCRKLRKLLRSRACATAQRSMSWKSTGTPCGPYACISLLILLIALFYVSPIHIFIDRPHKRAFVIAFRRYHTTLTQVEMVGSVLVLEGEIHACMHAVMLSEIQELLLHGTFCHDWGLNQLSLQSSADLQQQHGLRQTQLNTGYGNCIDTSRRL